MDTEIDAVVRLTSTIGAEVDVEFSIPDGLEIEDVEPQQNSPTNTGPLTTSIAWEDINFSVNGTATYTITLKPKSDVRGWIAAEVTDEGADSTAERLGIGKIAMLVNDSEGLLSTSGDGVFLDESVNNSITQMAERPLEMELSWDQIPAADETATATISMTNYAAYSVSIDGEFFLPPGWSIDSGSATWSDTITSLSTEAYTVSVEADSTVGPWSFPVVIDVGSSGEDYILRQLGRFDDSGDVWVEGQERLRADASTVHHNLRSEKLAEIAVPQSRIKVRGLAQSIDCYGPSVPGSTVSLNIDVDAVGSPASQLAIDVFWYYGNSATPPSRAGAKLYLREDRLDNTGGLSICINVPAAYDYAYVEYFVRSTDELGGFYKDWSTRVYSDLNGGRSLRSAKSELQAFQPSPIATEFNTDIEDTGADGFIFRLAAIHALHTRSFMTSGPGITIRGDGVPGQTEHKVIVWGNNTTDCAPQDPACARGPHYAITPAALGESADEVFLTAHHEYGHLTDYWLKGAPQCYWCGSSQAWLEGWADGVAAPADDNSGGEGRASYNGGTPVECVVCSPHHPVPSINNMLSMSGSLWDLWDGAGTETYDNTGIRKFGVGPTMTPFPTYTFEDEVAGQARWVDAWDLVDSSYIQQACHFRQQWDSQGKPQPTEVFAILDEHGITDSACSGFATAPALTPTPTLTPGPSPTPTPTCGAPYC
jgi:hypothetical protein